MKETNMTQEEFDLICKKGRECAEQYYGMHKNSEFSWKTDLKAWKYSDEDILKEFITTAYWYGYMDGKI